MIYNTVFIAVFKLVLGILVPVLFALLVNEIKNKIFSGYVQLVTCLPYFFCRGSFWAVFSRTSFRRQTALLMRSYGSSGRTGVFPRRKQHVPWTLIITDTWKNFGYSSIIYLAAMSSIDPALYEAAEIDGAGKIKQILHVTLPGILPMVFVMTVLSLGNVLTPALTRSSISIARRSISPATFSIPSSTVSASTTRNTASPRLSDS